MRYDLIDLQLFVHIAGARILVDIGDPGGVETFPFATDRLVLIAPKAHPLARMQTLAFRDALGEEFVGLGSSRALQELLERHAARAGQTMKVRVRMTTFEAISQMVELGAGIAIVPELAARRYRGESVGVVRLSDDWAIRRMLICCRKRTDLPDQVRRLVRHLVESNRGLPPDPSRSQIDG